MGTCYKIGSRLTSDVVVRLRTPEGRDDRVYCHSSVLARSCKYFADRLSDDWPTCQIIDARNCVEVHCQESDFDHHVTLLRLLYLVYEGSSIDRWHGVRSTLGILRVAVELGCPEIAASSVEYLEAVPWEEGEEEEVLRSIPSMGSFVDPILARLQPTDPLAVGKIFLSAVRFATSSPLLYMNDLKMSAQEQLEYMLSEDDDAPLLSASQELKLEVRECVKRLLCRYTSLLESFSGEPIEFGVLDEKLELLKSCLSDLSWASRILSKLEIVRDLVITWTETSDVLVKIIEQSNSDVDMLGLRLKVIEVSAKVLEAISCGSVIFPPVKRLQMVKVWLPFARVTKPLHDAALTSGGEEDAPTLRMDSEVWQSLESAFVSLILALPSADQAALLTEWLGSQYIQYPDLTEAFEVWCYRSKTAKKRLASVSGSLL